VLRVFTDFTLKQGEDLLEAQDLPGRGDPGGRPYYPIRGNKKGRTPLDARP